MLSLISLVFFLFTEVTSVFLKDKKSGPLFIVGGAARTFETCKSRIVNRGPDAAVCQLLDCFVVSSALVCVLVEELLIYGENHNTSFFNC